VLTDVSLKGLPNVETIGTLSLNGLSDRQAVEALSSALGSPFETTAAAHFPKGPSGDPVTMLRIEGFEASVNYRAGKIRELLKAYGDLEVTVGDGAEWTAVRDVTAFADQPGDVWRISAKPSDAPELAAKMDAKALQYDWGGGLIWALADEGRDLRAALGHFDGHATLIRGNADVPTFQPESPALAAITAGLRAKFDPRGILNSGIMS
jgi:glycolate oxidase FAD binding subunit